jgi:type 1 fimbria pilin
MNARTLLFGGLMAAAGSANAQSGLITLDGEVVTYTCVVSADGNAGSGDATVQLPTVAGVSLATPGSRAGLRPFDIVVGTATQPCAAKAVSGHWRAGGADVDPATGHLRNRPGPGMASGLGVVLLNDVQDVIDIRNNANSQQVIFDGGVATLRYHGEYIGNGGISEGLVSTAAEYELDYR